LSGRAELDRAAPRRIPHTGEATTRPGVYSMDMTLTTSERDDMETRVSYSGNGVWLAEAADGRGFINDHGAFHLIWRSQGTYYTREAAAAANAAAVERGWA